MTSTRSVKTVISVPFFFFTVPLVNGYAEADGEVLRRPSRESEVEIRVARNVAVTREDRVIIHFDKAQVYVLRDAHVQSSAEFHRKAGHAVVQSKVESGGRSLNVVRSLARDARERVEERFESPRLAVVLDLNAAEEIVGAICKLVSVNVPGSEIIGDRLGVEMAGDVALDAYVLRQVISDRSIEAVKPATVAEDALNVCAEVRRAIGCARL